MSKEHYLNIVATECAAEKEEFFNKWYNEVHIPLLMKYKGIKRVRRYKSLGESKDNARYLALYEYESKEDMDNNQGSPEFTAAIAEMQETWKDGGFDIKWTAQYEPIMSWEQ